MLCDECHENEAVVFYTEIINGEKKELHLCEACAAKETGMDHSFVSLTDTSFLANLLASVLGKRQETDDEEELADWVSDFISDEYGFCHDGFEIEGTVLEE